MRSRSGRLQNRRHLAGWLGEPTELLRIRRGRTGFFAGLRFAKSRRRRGRGRFSEHGSSGRQDVSRGAARANFLRQRLGCRGRDSHDARAVFTRRFHQVHQLLPREADFHFVLGAHLVAEDARRAPVDFVEVDGRLAVRDEGREFVDVEKEFRRDIVRAGAQQILRDAVEEIAEFQPDLRVARTDGRGGHRSQRDGGRFRLGRRAISGLGPGIGGLPISKKIGDALGGLVALPFASETIQKCFHECAVKNWGRVTTPADGFTARFSTCR